MPWELDDVPLPVIQPPQDLEAALAEHDAPPDEEPAADPSALFDDEPMVVQAVATGPGPEPVSLAALGGRAVDWVGNLTAEQIAAVYQIEHEHSRVEASVMDPPRGNRRRSQGLTIETHLISEKDIG